jgi:OmpA-OmpF porin, OOP family
MKLSNTICRAAVVMALSTCAVTAAMAKDSGFYAGASFGQAKYNTKDPAFVVFPYVVDKNREEKDWAYGLQFGYRFSPYIGVELSLNDYGDLEERTQGFTNTNLAAGGIADVEIGTRGVAIAAIATLPLNKFELFGKVGAIHAETKARGRIAQIFGTLPNTPLPPGYGIQKTENIAIQFGAGAGYAVGESLFLKLEYSYTPKVMDDGDVVFISSGFETDITEVSFGFQYRF